MAVTKRTRYEVLKRDNHTCRYCGATAPEVKLTVDHVTPVALGGSDDPSNLVAACRDCNAGKASTSPEATMVADVAQDAFRWAAAIRQAAAEAEADALRYVTTHEAFVLAWREWDDPLDHLPGNCWGTIDRWRDSGLSERAILESLDIARTNPRVRNQDVFSYLCGIANNKICELHDRAKQLLEAEGA